MFVLISSVGLQYSVIVERKTLITDAAFSMRSRVYVTVGRQSVRPSVRLSVCPVDRPQLAGLLLSAQRRGDIDRQLQVRCGLRRSAANAK